MRDLLYEIPEKITVRGILNDTDVDLGDYNDFVDSSYSSETIRDSLKMFDTANGELIGSSPFMNTTLANMTDKPGILPNGHTLSKLGDLRTMHDQNPDYFNKTDTDFGLALITETDSCEPNKYLAENLAGKLRERAIHFPKGGLLIPLSVLDKPQLDSNSSYGLVFEFHDFSKSELRDELEDLASCNEDTTLKGLLRAHGYQHFNMHGSLGHSLESGRVVGVGSIDTPRNLVFGHSDEEWRSAFNQANVSGIFNLVRNQL